MNAIKLPEAPPNVTVTVNGTEMQLPKGKNLLQALMDTGHSIPHYCYHPSLSVAGNCRLCLIEIEGRPKPEISCNMVVSDGLKIKTEGELVESCRHGMMEFLLVNHPLDCPICDRGGECMLQRYSMEYGWGHARTSDDRRRFVKPRFDPLIDIERNRCIMCTRCVRFCDEVGGEHVMGVFGHGDANYIGTYGNGPVSNPFSGNVIDLCPVGCLTSKPFRFKARAWELRQTVTTTRICNGPACAWTRDSKLYRVTPPPRRRAGLWTIDEDTKQFISNEARFGSLYANHPDRLLTPRVRRGGELVDCDWETALETAATALRGCAPGEACVLAGERGTNEEFYLLSRLARSVLQTPHIDWRSRFTSGAAARAVGAALAASNGDFDLLDKKAYGATLLIGADLLATAPDIALRLREAARHGRTKLGLLDTRVDHWTAEHASAVALETPAALAGAVGRLAVAVEESGAGGNAPQGYEKLFKLLKDHTQGLIAVGLDDAGGALTPALIPAALRLARALGEGWHFLPVTAARNAKGAFACGAQNDRLATGAVGDERARAGALEHWGGGRLAEGEGLTAPELLRRAAEGGFRALLLHRCDELVHHPQRELIERAIEKTPAVIAIDVFPSWIVERAQVVLPGAIFFETDGSMTDVDGTLQRMAQGMRPAGKAQEDWRVIESLSDLLGAPRRYRQAQEIFSDLSRSWHSPMPLRLDDLVLPGPGAQAPQVHRTMIGTRTRPDFKLHFSNGRAAADGAKPIAHAAATGDALPLHWIQHTHGLDHLLSRSTEYDALRPRPKVELNPADAARLGFGEGDWVVLEGGSAQPSQVALNPLLAEGVAHGAANVLGLRLTAGQEGLTAVRLVRTDPPVDVPANAAGEEVTVG